MSKRLRKLNASDSAPQQAGVDRNQIAQERRCGMSLKEPRWDGIAGRGRARERMKGEISMVREKRGGVRLGMAAGGKEALVKEDDRVRISALENRNAVFAHTRMNEVIIIQEENEVAAGVLQTEVARGAYSLACAPMDFDRRISGSQRINLPGILPTSHRQR